MSELPPDARAWLELASAPDNTAPAGASARVQRRIAALVGTATAASAASTVLESARRATGSAASLSATAKLLIVTACIASLGALGALWHSSRERSVAPQPPAATQSAPEPASPPLAPAHAAAESALPPVQPAASTPPSPAKKRPAFDSSLRSEMELLVGAQTALDQGDVPRARRLLRSHRRQYPNGQLLEERRGLETLAECLEGAGGALERAEAFLRQVPSSLLKARIRAACRIEADRK